MPSGPGDVLHLIRHGRATTRGDVLEATGLSRVTISQRLDALLAAGMIVEGEHSEATGGRRRRSLAFNTSQSHVLVAAIDTTHTRIAVTDLGGAVLVEDSIDVAVSAGPSEVLDRIVLAMGAVLGKRDLEPDDLCGLGLSLPARGREAGLGPIRPGPGPARAARATCGPRRGPIARSSGPPS